MIKLMYEQPDLLLQNNTTAPWQQLVTKTYLADARVVTIPGLHDWHITGTSPRDMQLLLQNTARLMFSALGSMVQV